MKFRFNFVECFALPHSAFPILLLLLSCSLLSSCIKENNGQTIALIGTEYYIEDILKVIPDSLRADFDSHFGDIPEGAIPDSIAGKYVVSPKMRVYTNGAYEWPLTIPEPNDTLCFYKQHNGIVALELNEAGVQKTDTVFVMGHDNAFTVYFVEEKTVLQAQIRRGIVMAGKLKSEGIQDFRCASIIMKVKGQTEGEPLVPGTFKIYKDGNGLAERIEE